MKKHEILSPQSRAALFDPPTDPAEIVRHYTFSPEDLALIRRRRRDAGFLFVFLTTGPGTPRGIWSIPEALAVPDLNGLHNHPAIRPPDLASRTIIAASRMAYVARGACLDSFWSVERGPVILKPAAEVGEAA